MHRHIFKILSQNRDYVQTHCNDRNDTFHFACRKWYLYKNPRCLYSIITRIRIQKLPFSTFFSNQSSSIQFLFDINRVNNRGDIFKKLCTREANSAHF